MPVIRMFQLEAIHVAIGSIISSRVRSMLTILGVVIGVAVVALVAALLEAAQVFIAETTAALAPDVVRIEKASFQDFAGDGQEFALARARRPDLTIDDIRTLKDRIGDRIEVGAQVDASLPVRAGGKTLDGILIQGVTPNIAFLSNIKLARGRELTDIDDQFRRPVCIIGADVEELLFPTREPLGEVLYVGALPYQIIAVAEPRGSLFGQSQDAFVQLPLGAFGKIFGERSRSIALLARPRVNSNIGLDGVEEAVRAGMRQVRRLQPSETDDFSIVTARSVAAFSSRITGLVGYVLYPLTGIALAVSGVVVMNMMLASVTERTREIGIRKAIGARRRDILAQFLVESTMLTLGGGLLGLLLARAIVWLAAALTGLPVGLPLWAVAAAILISCLVGIIFGVVPARRAARLDPIEALRTE